MESLNTKCAKSKLSKTGSRVIEHYKSKSEIFSYLNQKQFTSVSSFEAIIKEKASLAGVQKTLDTKKVQIDAEELLAKERYQVISSQSSQHRILLQDVQYLVSIPLSELKLTVENSIVKL